MARGPSGRLTSFLGNKFVYVWKIEQSEIDELVNGMPKLPVKVAEAQEGEITIEEAGNVLKNMKNGESPGTDGAGQEPQADKASRRRTINQK
ncbi:hypothetical protein C0Q70_19678 [Pomacea canaliculata]|uniref:Uncharacterized protein n=1 Tax=Pomacea canaliculata TaxID=400727 RepID=A0A2T7NDE9_POMCA|nr:hypothetical protein C0Q70_19678 [Pomacea canaliculata]